MIATYRADKVQMRKAAANLGPMKATIGLAIDLTHASVVL